METSFTYIIFPLIVSLFNRNIMLYYTYFGNIFNKSNPSTIVPYPYNMRQKYLSNESFINCDTWRLLLPSNRTWNTPLNIDTMLNELLLHLTNTLNVARDAL